MMKVRLNREGKRVQAMLITEYQMTLESAEKLLQDGGLPVATALMYLLRRKDASNARPIHKI